MIITEEIKDLCHKLSEVRAISRKLWPTQVPRTIDTWCPKCDVINNFGKFCNKCATPIESKEMNVCSRKWMEAIIYLLDEACEEKEMLGAIERDLYTGKLVENFQARFREDDNNESAWAEDTDV